MAEKILDGKGVRELTVRIGAYFNLDTDQLQQNNLNAGHVLHAVVDAVEASGKVDASVKDGHLLDRARAYATKIANRSGRHHTGYYRDGATRGSSYYQFVYEDTFDSIASQLCAICTKAGIDITFDAIVAGCKDIPSLPAASSTEWSPGAEARYTKALAEGLGIQPPSDITFSELWKMFRSNTSLQDQEIIGITSAEPKGIDYKTATEHMTAIKKGVAGDIEAIPEAFLRSVGEVIRKNLGTERVSYHKLRLDIAERCGIDVENKSGDTLYKAFVDFLEQHNITRDKLNAFVTDAASPMHSAGQHDEQIGFASALLPLYQRFPSSNKLDTRTANIIASRVQFLTDNPEMANMMYPALKAKLETQQEAYRVQHYKPRIEKRVKQPWHEEAIPIEGLGTLKIAVKPQKSNTVVTLSIVPRESINVAPNTTTVTIMQAFATNDELMADERFTKILEDTRALAEKEQQRLKDARGNSDQAADRFAFFAFASAFSKEMSSRHTRPGGGVRFT